MKIIIQMNSTSFPSKNRIETEIMIPKFIKYVFIYQSKNKRLLGLIFKMGQRQGSSMCFRKLHFKPFHHTSFRRD
jgi:hypothetical protein